MFVSDNCVLCDDMITGILTNKHIAEKKLILVICKSCKFWFRQDGSVRKPHHRCQFSGFSNMRNALQSRRDYMFIALNVPNLFRSVGAMSNKNVVQISHLRSERDYYTFFYKHIVPTGLNIGQSQSSCLSRSVHKNTNIFLN